MIMNRRNFLRTSGLGVAAMSMTGVIGKNTLAASIGAVGVGITDWNLGGSCNPDLIPKAKEANLDGIQVSVGLSPDNIPLRDPEIRKKYIEMGKRYGIKFNSVAAGSILNKIPLGSEPQAAVYVIDAIEAAKALGAKNILIAFFGAGELRLRGEDKRYNDLKDGEFSSFELNTKAVDRVVEALRQIAPRAEDAGVAMGLENTLTAKQNIEVLERIGSKMAQIYYDVGEMWGVYDDLRDMRLLGYDRICEVHIKDRKTRVIGSPEGQVDMVQCAQVLSDIGYDKWLVLETSGRKDQFIEDTKTSVAFIKKTFKMAG